MVDAVLRGSFRLTIGKIGWLLLPLAGKILVALTVWHRTPLVLSAIVATLLLVFALLAALFWRSIPGLIVIALLSAFLYGRPLMLSQKPSDIHRSSALIAAIKQNAGEARFAIADPGMKEVLPPNQETLFGLKSPNSYDSLSPRRYQELTRHWSAQGTNTYGRHFKVIDPEVALSDPGFRLANISLILSKRTLSDAGVSKIAEVNGIGLYRPQFAPFGLLQMTSYKPSGNGEIEIDPFAIERILPSQRVAQLDDYQKILVSASTDQTLLFISQQHHPAWQATANDRQLRTVLVNRFYQGVIIPPLTREIELSFRPCVRWSWVPQVFFAAGAALLFLRSLQHPGRAKSVHPG